MIAGAILATSRTADAQSSSHRWAGHIADVHVHETASGGVEAWTVEDGGRIRHRNPTTGAWSFQSVPDPVQDTLHRVQFLDKGQGAGIIGWAVGAGGWVVKTTNGGATWNVQAQIHTPLHPVGQVPAGVDPWEELYDIHFLNALEGWVIGAHAIWSTEDGGDTWTPLTGQFVPGGSPMTSGRTYDLHLPFVKLYGLDIVERPDGSRLGLVVGQPGIVLKSESTTTDFSLSDWVVVWDVGLLCPFSADCGDVTVVLEGCACAQLCGIQGPFQSTDVPDGLWMEIWDVKIGVHPTEPLALFVGGVGNSCGTIYASTDDGGTWGVEPHECTCPGGPPCVACNGLPAYNPDPQNPDHLFRQKKFRMQYDLHMYADNSAVSVGYNGQQTVRDPATGVWLDRSQFAVGLPTKPNSVIFPLTGVGGVTLASGAKVAITGGMGGLLRESFDGGHTWTTIGEHAPHRIADLCFLDDSTGWHVGQFSRISRTIDGAVSWAEQQPVTQGGNKDLYAIACEPSSDQRAVAVGEPYVIEPGVNDNTLPTIRYTNLQNQPVWFENATILGSDIEVYADFIDQKSLRDVTSNGTEFLAVGQGGLAMRSSDGATWRLVLPEQTSAIADFEMEGVAFQDTITGLIVGRRLVEGVLQGVVYQHSTSTTTPTWMALTLPTNVQIIGLWDVAIGNDEAWVVGEKLVDGEPVGIALKATWSGSTFGAFSEDEPSGGFPRCVTGDSPGGIPVLNAVAVAPGTGQVWAGGACGRLWVYATPGGWTQVKSQTDAHVLGMSFVPLGTTNAAGYLGCFRGGQTQQCIVRVQ